MLLRKYLAAQKDEASGPFKRHVNVGRVSGKRFIKQLRKKVRRQRAT